MVNGVKNHRDPLENPSNKSRYLEERQTILFIKRILGEDKQIIIRELEKTILRYETALKTAIEGEVKNFFEEQYKANKRTKILYLAGIIS